MIIIGRGLNENKEAGFIPLYLFIKPETFQGVDLTESCELE